MKGEVHRLSTGMKQQHRGGAAPGESTLDANTRLVHPKHARLPAAPLVPSLTPFLLPPSPPPPPLQALQVGLTRKQIARMIGRVFIQKSAVNLLSTVLDTPEFFWSAPDSMQNLYKRVCEYMEYDTRVEVLNNRFQVLQEMLDM